MKACNPNFIGKYLGTFKNAQECSKVAVDEEGKSCTMFQYEQDTTKCTCCDWKGMAKEDEFIQDPNHDIFNVR